MTHLFPSPTPTPWTPSPLAPPAATTPRPASNVPFHEAVAIEHGRGLVAAARVRAPGVRQHRSHASGSGPDGTGDPVPEPVSPR